MWVLIDAVLWIIKPGEPELARIDLPVYVRLRSSYHQITTLANEETIFVQITTVANEETLYVFWEHQSIDTSLHNTRTTAQCYNTTQQTFYSLPGIYGIHTYRSSIHTPTAAQCYKYDARILQITWYIWHIYIPLFPSAEQDIVHHRTRPLLYKATRIV